MCGRFVGYRGIAELKDVFPIDLVETEVDLDNILDKMIHKDFSSRPVSKAVNSVKNNSPELIQES